MKVKVSGHIVINFSDIKLDVERVSTSEAEKEIKTIFRHALPDFEIRPNITDIEPVEDQ